MLSPELQKTIVAATFEFPANSTVTHPNAKVGSWMGFKANSTPWADLTPFLNQSTTLMKSVNYK
jgi:hypothetical protein